MSALRIDERRVVLGLGACLALAVGCQSSAADREIALAPPACDSAAAHRLIVDTVAALDTIPMRIVEWHTLDSGWSASLYPDSRPPAIIMDGGVAVRVSPQCRVLSMTFGDSV